MIALALLRASQPPPPAAIIFAALLFLVLFPLLTAVTNRLLGIPALYEAFPADPTDPIEARLGWTQVEFGTFRGHTPMSVALGRRCLHLKQPFPFQAAWWRGPASIPWSEIRIEAEGSGPRLTFLRRTAFRLGSTGRIIRMRGRVAKRIQERLQAGDHPPAAIRPA